MLLKNCVPGFITEEIQDFEVIYKIQQEEIDKVNKDIREALAQFFVYRATWGIQDWETFLGIVTNSAKELDDRQARVIAKLRGQGTSTLETIENVAKSFIDDREVDVIEHNEDYYFEIDLKSTSGFPYELNGLYDSIEEIKPAHLNVDYKLISKLQSPIYIAALNLIGERITIYPWTPRKIESKARTFIPMNDYLQLEKITVYPKEEKS